MSSRERGTRGAAAKDQANCTTANSANSASLPDFGGSGSQPVTRSGRLQSRGRVPSATSLSGGRVPSAVAATATSTTTSSSNRPASARDLAAAKQLLLLEETCQQLSEQRCLESGDVGSPGGSSTGMAGVGPTPRLSVNRCLLELKKFVDQQGGTGRRRNSPWNKMYECVDVVQNVFLAKAKPNVSAMWWIPKVTEDPLTLLLACNQLETIALADPKNPKILARLGITSGMLEFLNRAWTLLQSDVQARSAPNENHPCISILEVSLRVLLLHAKHGMRMCGDQFLYFAAIHPTRVDLKLPLMVSLTKWMDPLLEIVSMFLKRAGNSAEQAEQWHPMLSMGWSLARDMVNTLVDSNARHFWKSHLRDSVVQRHLSLSKKSSSESVELPLDWYQAARQMSACLKHDNISPEWVQQYGVRGVMPLVEMLKRKVDYCNVTHVKTQLSVLSHLLKQAAFVEHMKANSDAMETLWPCLETILSGKQLEKVSDLVSTIGFSLIGFSPLPFLDRDTLEKIRIQFPLNAMLAKESLQQKDSTVIINCQTFCNKDQGKDGVMPPVKAKSAREFEHVALPNLLHPDDILERARKLPAEPTIPPSDQPMVNQIRNISNRLAFQSHSEYRIVYDCHDSTYAKQASPEFLEFESRFESGNLWRAIAISHTEYDLLIDQDVNSDFGKNNQWFYFCFRTAPQEARSPKSNAERTPKTIRFNIINVSKLGGSFTQGMQPVFFSRREFETSGTGWRRHGFDISHHSNHYIKAQTEKNGNTETECFATVHFSITVPPESDECYLAYHYPYTYTQLQGFLHDIGISRNFVRRNVLCNTLAGNPCDVLTITDFHDQTNLSSRKPVLLSARIHPGETNSSWMMHGILKQLLSEEAHELRQRFVFQVVPMLNPDGVIHGSYRCSLAGVDLNRQWKHPSLHLHPTIFYTKALWRHMTEQHGQPLLSCDFHGHSRRKNVFFFGCHTTKMEEAAPLGTVTGMSKILPNLLPRYIPTRDHPLNANGYDTKSNKFSIESSKETTARVVLWRELGILCSYTCESTFFGADAGPLKGQQFTTYHLYKMGQYFNENLLFLDHLLTEIQHINTRATSTTAPASLSQTQQDFQTLLKQFPFLADILSIAGSGGESAKASTPKSARTTGAGKMRELKRGKTESSLVIPQIDMTQLRKLSLSLAETMDSSNSTVEDV